MLYFILFYLFFSYPILRNISNKKIVIFLEVFPIFCVLAFQNAVGTDYYSYIRIFNGEKSFAYSKGPIFKLIVMYLKIIFSNERAMFITVAAIQMILFFKIIKFFYEKNFIKNISLFIFLSLSTTTFYFEMFNILRNSIASLFIVLSVLFFLEKKKLKSFILILFGASFHPSVIIYSVIFTTKKILYKKSTLRLLFFISSCFLLNRIDFIPKAATFIYETNFDFPYKFYLKSNHMFPYTKTFGAGSIINLIIFLFSLNLVYRKEKDRNKIFIYNIGYIFFALQCLFINIPILTRLIGGGCLFENYIIYNLIEILLKKKNYILGIILVLYYLLFFVRRSLLIVPAY